MLSSIANQNSACASKVSNHRNPAFLPMEDSHQGNGRRGATCRGHWTPAEDEKLLSLVTQLGPKNWNAIAEHIEGRTGKSCRLRWFNQLDPSINNQPFTAEEEARLLAAQQAHGNKWSVIARHFPGRTDNALKNHFHVIMSRRCKDYTLSQPFHVPSLGNNVASLTGANGVSIGTSSRSNNWIPESTFRKYTRNIKGSCPGIGTPYPFSFRTSLGPNYTLGAPAAPAGTGSSAAPAGNFNLAGAFGSSHFGLGTQQAEMFSHMTYNDAFQTPDWSMTGETPPSFIDFLGVGSSNN